MKYLVTGGSGFIGSHLIKLLLKNKKNHVLNIDKLSYAANNKLNDEIKSKKYSFKKIDISNYEKIKKQILNFQPNIIFNLAAETHVDRSISNSKDFIFSNIIGTFSILQASRKYLSKVKNKKDFKFIHISTDEVYGSLKKSMRSFTENSNYLPNSPYAASKASSDHLIRAWNKTYNFPSILTHCSNNYGSHQNYEKFIPKIIINAINNRKIPIYGSGRQLREWIHVSDHVNALLHVSIKGKIGETYNIGSNIVKENIFVAKAICKRLNKIYNNKNKNYEDLIEYVEDRPGHDFKYALNISKIKKQLNWSPKISFNEGLNQTIEWYLKESKK